MQPTSEIKIKHNFENSKSKEKLKQHIVTACLKSFFYDSQFTAALLLAMALNVINPQTKYTVVLTCATFLQEHPLFLPSQSVS